MDASTPPSKWGSVADYKKRKADATPDGKRAVLKPDDRPRDLTLGQYQNNSKPGCWLRANVKGSRFKVDRNHPLLSLAEHDLVVGTAGYFDFGWNSQFDVNMGKMISMIHAEKAAQAIVSRFSDLTFRVDLSNGKFYTDEAMAFWNNAKGELAIVGMSLMKDRIARIFPSATLTDRDCIYWADNQAGLLISNATNPQIEGAADEIQQLALHFGITLNLIMTDVDSSHEPEPSPERSPA